LSSYEITFIVRPDLDDDGMRGAVETVRSRIETVGGQILSGYPWGPGRRRMAYPIRDFNDGYYYTITFNAGSEALRGLESNLRLNENVLRFLLVAATPQMLRNAEQRQHQQAQVAAQPPAQPAPAPVPVGAGVAATEGAVEEAATVTAPEAAESGAVPIPGPEEAPEPVVVAESEAAPEAAETATPEEVMASGAHPVPPEGE
jgi:small subunit ribosomal protein S6